MVTANEINIDFILYLYDKYISDLITVRKLERKLLSKAIDYRFQEYQMYRMLRTLLKQLGVVQIGAKLTPRFDDIEAEITYLLIREFKPQTVVEISPADGWSTSWILNALKDNGSGKLYSYDLVDNATKNIPLPLAKDRWTFCAGDIKKNIDKLPEKIDYLFIDSDHSAEFAAWYIENIFSRLERGTPVSVHDVFQSEDWYFPEKEVILDWLRMSSIDYFSASFINAKEIFERICSSKKRLNICSFIHKSRINPAIFFIYK